MKIFRVLFGINFLLIFLALFTQAKPNYVEFFALELLNSILIIVSLKKSLFDRKMNPFIVYTFFYWLYFCFSTVMIKFYGFSFLLINLKYNLEGDVSYFSAILFLSFIFSFLGYLILKKSNNSFQLDELVKRPRNVYLYYLVLFFFLIPLSIYRIFGFYDGFLLSTTYDIEFSNPALRLLYILNSIHLLIFFFLLNSSLIFNKRYIVLLLLFVELIYIFLSGNRREFLAVFVILLFLNTYFEFVRLSRIRIIILSLSSLILLTFSTFYGYYISFGNGLSISEFLNSLAVLDKEGLFGANIFLWMSIGPVIQSYNGLIFFIQSFDFARDFGPQGFFSLKYFLTNLLNSSDPKIVREILNSYGNYITIAKYDETPLTLLLSSDIIISTNSLLLLFVVSFIIGVAMKFVYNLFCTSRSYLLIALYISYFFSFSLGFMYSPISGDTVLPFKILIILLIFNAILYPFFGVRKQKSI